MQLVWLLFLPADAYDNVLMIWSDAGAADAIDTTQRTINSTAGAAVAVIALARWWRAAPALRRLLLPVLAGGIAAAVLAGTAYYRLLAGEWMRPTFEITSVVLFLIPLAFLVGALRAQMARAGMADLVVALHRAPDAKGLGAVLARTLRDPSLELVYWLPGFETYVDDEGKPVALPAAGSGRVATPVMHDGEPVAALVHDAALDVRAASCWRWSPRPSTWRSSGGACMPSWSRASRSSRARARGSSKRVMPRAARSSATSTTARSSASCRWRSRCG